jgi:hypothetical protein
LLSHSFATSSPAADQAEELTIAPKPNQTTTSKQQQQQKIMWRRLLAVAVCIINNDRHCDPVVPIDTTVDPRYPCQADADFGTFGKLFSNNSITVEFQYQIETIMTTMMTTTTNTTTTSVVVSNMALKQVERALSNVLANSFFECRRRRRTRRRQRRNRNRNLQEPGNDEEVIMSLDSLRGISAAPADRIYPGGA